MLTRIRSGLTYANVTATLALFIALGGGAYAALKLPKNSVGTRQLQANAVNSSKVADGSLVAGDFRAGQLPAGPQGPKGDPGVSGTNGADGADGPAGSTQGVGSDAGGTLTPQLILDPHTVTTTRAGILFVSKVVRNVNVTCSGGGAYRVWQTLDGARVPGFVSGDITGSTTFPALTLTGVTATPVAAGDHTSGLAIMCVTASLVSANAIEGGESAIVLG
jgi:hypothetical protein